MATETRNSYPNPAVVPSRVVSGPGTLFGVPLRDLGFFATLLMGLASAFVAFFAGTFLGIVGIMVMNASGHLTDYSLSYRRVGFPLGIVVGVVALSYLYLQWVRRITRKA